jgi:peptide deformylase
MKDFIQNPPTEIVKYPDPILLQKAQPVSEINEDVKQACSIMFDLMYQFKGVGLAGPQAGLPYRIFVANHTGAKDKERVFINPKIIYTGNRTSTAEEGCLSLPGVRVAVTRPHKVSLQAYDLDGNLQKYTFEGLMGRIVQHEIDHLDGVLINIK